MARSIKEMMEMSDEKLNAEYEKVTAGNAPGLEFYHDEYVRRKQDKQTQTLIRFTKYITWLTYVVTVTTIVNLIVAVELLRR